jgi:hypothetical protein
VSELMSHLALEIPSQGRLAIMVVSLVLFDGT